MGEEALGHGDGEGHDGGVTDAHECGDEPDDGSARCAGCEEVDAQAEGFEVGEEGDGSDAQEGHGDEEAFGFFEGDEPAEDEA